MVLRLNVCWFVLVCLCCPVVLGFDIDISINVACVSNACVCLFACADMMLLALAYCVA